MNEFLCQARQEYFYIYTNSLCKYIILNFVFLVYCFYFYFFISIIVPPGKLIIFLNIKSSILLLIIPLLRSFNSSALRESGLFLNNAPGSARTKFSLIKASFSVAVGSGSGSVSALGTVTFTGASSVSINDVFSATYSNYLIVWNDLTTSSTGWMNMRMRVSGADDSTANYRYQELSGSGTTVAAARATGATAWANINYAQDTNHNPNTLTIFNPFDASPTSISSVQAPVSNGNIEVFAKSFGLNTNTSYTGFSFFPASAGPTLTGSVSVYGYNK